MPMNDFTCDLTGTENLLQGARRPAILTEH